MPLPKKKKKVFCFAYLSSVVCSSKLNTLTAASTNSESALGSFQMPYFGNFSPNMRHFAPSFKKAKFTITILIFSGALGPALVCL